MGAVVGLGLSVVGLGRPPGAAGVVSVGPAALGMAVAVTLPMTVKVPLSSHAVPVGANAALPE